MDEHNVTRVTKLTDLSRAITRVYMTMASETKVQRKVSKFIRA